MRKCKAKFSRLIVDRHYDVIDADTGRWITQGIQGADALAFTWPVGAEIWPAGEEEFNGDPIDVAK